MKLFAIFILLLVHCGCQSPSQCQGPPLPSKNRPLERIVAAADGRGFVLAKSQRPFQPWGLNYGNSGRLMEDFWEVEWETIVDDFREMKALGANVVRLHLQFGKFMSGPNRTNANSFKQFGRLLRLAEQTGLYLDVTGLAAYRPADVPAWYDQLDESARWTVQGKFWEAVAKECAASPSVFCYNLMNEPISPGQRRQPGKWSSGSLFGGYDFIQYIALDPAGRSRDEIARQWIQRMSTAIRRHDANALITVGLLPWSRQLKHLSGFVPEKIAQDVDFISVHIYPDKNRPDEAMESLRQCVAGKPVVIEETFPLTCGTGQLETFLQASREIACGWVGHYDGASLAELDAMERKGVLSLKQSLYREWLRLFKRLKPKG